MREPEIYGSHTLEDIHTLCLETAKKYNITIEFKQSNHEGELVTWIQEAVNKIDAIIINAAAYTHTSVAIHDALKLLPCPIIEVHLSNPEKREEFRSYSYIAELASDIIKGQGAHGYAQAIEIISKKIQ